MPDRPMPPPPDIYHMDSQEVRDGAPFTGAVSITAGGSKLFYSMSLENKY